jgi:16S rRNA (adenine1518-N6/adenine1519-N6)-dimethyltransferase
VIEELEYKPTQVVLTIQKEVAERICATVPHMNLLAASVQYWAKPSIVDIVPKADFNPPPKVDSATIKLEVQPTKGDSAQYYITTRKLFTQPRKTIANNLAGKDGSKEEVAKKLEAIGVDAQKRPHDLTVADIRSIEKIYE